MPQEKSGSLRITYDLKQEVGNSKDISIKVQRRGNGLRVEYSGGIEDLKDADIDAMEQMCDSLRVHDGAAGVQSAYVEIARHIGKIFYGTAEYLATGEVPTLDD